MKIGHSADVSARVRQHEAHYGQPLALLATLSGGAAGEREEDYRDQGIASSRPSTAPETPLTILIATLEGASIVNRPAPEASSQ